MAINEFGDENTSVISAEFIRDETGCIVFSNVKKFTISELYPFPWKDPWET